MNLILSFNNVNLITFYRFLSWLFIQKSIINFKKIRKVLWLLIIIFIFLNDFNEKLLYHEHLNHKFKLTNWEK